jgi:hypothetical protein
VDVGEVAIGAGVVYAVAYDELVRDLEAEVPYGQVDLPPLRLAEQRADL